MKTFIDKNHHLKMSIRFYSIVSKKKKICEKFSTKSHEIVVQCLS